MYEFSHDWPPLYGRQARLFSVCPTWVRFRLALLLALGLAPAAAAKGPTYTVSHRLEMEWKGDGPEGLAKCKKLAKKAGTHGAALVWFYMNDDGDLTAAVKWTDGISRKVRDCIEGLAKASTHRWASQAKNGPGQPTGDLYAKEIELGKPAPFLPSPSKVLPKWKKLAAGKGKPRALAKLLPPYASLTGDGCVELPGSSVAEQAASSWLAGVGSEVSRYWVRSSGEYPVRWIDDDWLISAERLRPWGRDAILHVAPSHSPMHAFVLGRQGLRLCLVRQNDEHKQELLAETDRRVGCLVGDLKARLTTPRYDFPKDRHFTRVSPSDRQVCAIDDQGALLCCGNRVSGEPSGRFIDVAVGARHACAIDDQHGIHCWGENDHGQSYMPDQGFDRVFADGDRTCAIETHGSGVCWGMGGYDVVHGDLPLIGLAFRNSRACGLMEDGATTCDTGAHYQRLMLAVDGTSFCGLQWNGTTDCGPRAPSEPLLDVASARAVYCGINEDGKLACWPNIKPPTGTYTSVAGGDSTLCAIAKGGGIDCFSTGSGAWPARAL